MPNYNGINYTASTDGPYFSSGEIKWSDIRSTFNPSGSNQNIKASDYIRYINTDLKDPLLPDCTENNAVPSSQSNWKTSQLRNTIRRYYVVQNISINNSYLFRDVNEDGSGSTRWNGNVPKNIVKQITMNRNTTSTDTTKFACVLNAAIGNTPVDTNCYNMTVILPSGGRIIGAGGAGGARDSAGGDGGPALLISSNGSNNRFIKEAQQINRYNSEDINVQELRNGNLEETHNLGSIMPGENLTSNQAQSLVSRIYKRDKDFIESTFTFQLRHNDDNTLDIIVNIQD